jgi:hypothetical protein
MDATSACRPFSIARFKNTDEVRLTLKTPRFDPYFNSTQILPQIVAFLQEKPERCQAAKMRSPGKTQEIAYVERPGDRARLSATGNLDDS